MIRYTAILHPLLIIYFHTLYTTMQDVYAKITHSNKTFIHTTANLLNIQG